MASPSPPLSRSATPDSTESDSENEEGSSALPHTSPASTSIYDNALETSSPSSWKPQTRETVCGFSTGSYYQAPVNDSQPQNLALTDYEEQLRLLDVQNKKRYAATRGVQENMHRLPVQKSTRGFEEDVTVAPQTSVLDRAFGSPPNHRAFELHAQQQLAAAHAINQARVDQSRLHQARLQLQLQQYSLYKTSQTAREKQNQDSLQVSDLDASLQADSRVGNSSSNPGFCGSSHTEPCNSAATNLLGSALSNEEIGQIQTEKTRSNLEAAARQQQYIHKQITAAQDAVIASQVTNRGLNNFYPVPQGFRYQGSRAINPQNPHYVSAQTIHSRIQGPPLYHSFQAIGGNASTYMPPSMADADGASIPSGAKRGSSSDLSASDRFFKRSKPTIDSPVCSQDIDTAKLLDEIEEPGQSSTSQNQMAHIQHRESPTKDIDIQANGTEEEPSKASPAHSSATLDDEEDREPLTDLEMEIDRENITGMKSTDLDSGISVTTTTFKDGKTTTVMHVGGGSVQGKAREMRQGVEIVTKTVVIKGVVTTTTTTALIPMPIKSDNGDDEEGDED